MAFVGAGQVVLAQDTTVTGRVVDSTTNQPIAGADVGVRGARAGMTTPANGEFRLRVHSLSDTLEVRFIGYAPQVVPLAGRSTVVVPLSPVALGLTGIVTVGYGTQNRADVTGSVSSVSAARLSAEPTTNMVESLQGGVAGLNVSTTGSSAEGSYSIQIRGANSITASNAPLVVVDGIPYGGGLSELNPAEIQSVDVLKDASAAAIYGARGSNGVILVTTKRGRGQPTYNYAAHVGVANAVDVPQLMSGSQFGPFKCEHINGGVPCTSAEVAATLTASELANYHAGNSTDWVGIATHKGVQAQQTLSFSGGSDQTQYYVSGGLLDNQGAALNDEYRRYDMRVNFEQQMSSWLSVGTNTQLGLINRSGVGASFSEAFVQNPLNSAFDSTGAQLVYPWPEDVFFPNPLQGLLATDHDNSRRVFTSNHVQVDLPWMQGLSYRVNGGVDYENRKHGSYYGRTTETGFSNQGLATTSALDRYNWTLENLLTYKRVFGNHGVDVTALYSQESDKSENDGLRSSGFPNDVLTYYQANVGQSVIPSYAYAKSGLESQMLRVNYTYGDRFLVTGTVRRDGFSGFGANHKYGVFPSLALGWNIAQEQFWPAKGAVPTFKLRASWGENGNEAIRPYQTLATLGEASYVDGGATAPGYIPVTLANPDLRWETSAQTNFGADFGMFDNRITGSVDFYWSRTHDLLLNRSISPVEGISSVLENIGKVANRGVELGLTTRNIERRRMGWETNFTFSVNRNRVVDLYGDGNDDLANQWFIGRPIDVNFGYAFGGIWQSADSALAKSYGAKPGDVRVKDLNGDGAITADDRTILGSLQATYIAGMTNTVHAGPVTLSAFMNTVQGVQRANPLLSPTVVGPQVRFNTVVHDYWSPTNPIDTYSANREGVNPFSVGFYQNSSFVRLQDLLLGVDIPTHYLPLGTADRLRVYIDGKNLWTYTKWTGLDPAFTNGNQRGTPLARTFILGLDLGF